MIDSIIAKNETKQKKKYNIDGTNSFGSDFTIRAIDTTNSAYVRGSRAIYPILFLCNRYYELYRYSKGIAYTINDENKKFLNNLFRNTFSKQVISGKYLYEEGAYLVDKDEQDIMFFLPTGLKKPCAMKPNDSFIIDGKIGKILLWCHIYKEAEGLENEFMGIPVIIQEHKTTGQLHFNIDGSPQVLKLSDKQSDQDKRILCGIKMSPNLQSNNTEPYRDDIVLYSQYEFDFYAQEGQKCCNEDIDNQLPIRYHCVGQGRIQLTFTNKKGQKITVDVNEKGESLKEIEEKKQNAISELKDKIKIEFEDKENNPSFDFDKSLTFVVGTTNNNKVDGLSVDKNEPAKFIINKTEGITQIYRLDKQNFPLEHDNNHEIIYTKQANGKNYVNYYDKNGKQIIEPMEKIKERIPYAKSGVLCSENGEYLTDLGLMKYDKADKTFKFYKNLSNQAEYYQDLETLKQDLEKLRENYNEEKQEIDWKMIYTYNKEKDKTKKSEIQTKYNAVLKELREKYNTAKKEIEKQERKLISTRMNNYDKNKCEDLGLL